ncbi:hypothetical protein CLAFUW4_10844 [Fulvia fulva]|uniref:Uncharacterized protein n=1 Tax=Passalora fulva TaxID=5499 RepID=A0A9Q8PCZ4_PASFU|nr:uncharacterized protein CLAFUR5_09887 [Fulvia fulva]KAK4619363.1 hypothetical protein CLAFUR4_10849 [Fulvia fulva]KAK4620320.1 hypothetical protein CLAFUR0_10856 [Fulvia fulva]UJO20160.1 hypothetical protein CLAFUR5_09887 [Fulvia fulva]WPV17768.1 hypothetical protein CLAFUW4_10844 [Fulvia fulva]WPV32304.1 hypothetical protein CLAFUW7_10842 [Fulvia fulva]
MASNDYIDSAQHAYCNRFCCSDFFRYQEAELSLPASLQTEILPIFSQEHFTADKQYATGYDAIADSLRLASQLLLSGGAARYICTMVEGNVFHIHEDDTRTRVTLPDIYRLRAEGKKPLFAQYPRSKHVQNSVYTKARARQILDNLSKLVTFHFDDSLPDGMNGMTQTLPGPLTTEQARVFPGGSNVRIRIAGFIYKKLNSLNAQQDPHREYSQRDIEKVLHIRFTLAKLLVHELGHALNIAVQGSIKSIGEPFDGDCELSEGGFALENAIFDGILGVNSCMSHKNYTNKCSRACTDFANTTSTIPLTLDEWPSGTYQHSYQRAGLLLASRRQLPKVDKTHRVPLMFLQNLFSRAYWEHFVDPESLGPLTVPTAGIWYGNCESTPCEIDEIQEGEFPKDALWDIVMDEVAAGSRPLVTITSDEDSEKVRHVPLRGSIDSDVSATDLTEAVEVDQPVALIGWAEAVEQPVAVVKQVASGKPVVVTPPVAVELCAEQGWAGPQPLWLMAAERAV